MIEETLYLCKKDDFDEDGKILIKQSHRAIILDHTKLLLAHVGRYGDYRFPGGKLDVGETIEDGLKREVLEEAGANVTSITPFARIITKNIERINADYDYFILDSYFYICEIDSSLTEPTLDEREIADNFTRQWVEIDQAIEVNTEVMNGSNPSLVVARETRMLEIIKEYIQKHNPKEIP